MRTTKIFLLLLFITSLISLVGAQNNTLSCQYQESVPTDNYIQTLYTNEGERLVNPAEVTDIVSSSSGRPSFKVVNPTPYTLSIRVQYDVSHSGGGRSPNKERELEISPYDQEAIMDDGFSKILWGTTSISNIRITYLSNDDLEVKSEKVFQDVCKQCEGTDCLNDGQVCSKDSQCGSGICNIAGFCGKEKIVKCPENQMNCNNLSCLLVGVKENGEEYSCSFECKSGYGNDGICEMPTKEKVSKTICVIIFLIILIVIIYIIITEKNPIRLIKR